MVLDLAVVLVILKVNSHENRFNGNTGYFCVYCDITGKMTVDHDVNFQKYGPKRPKLTRNAVRKSLVLLGIKFEIDLVSSRVSFWR